MWCGPVWRVLRPAADAPATSPARGALQASESTNRPVYEPSPAVRLRMLLDASRDSTPVLWRIPQTKGAVS